MPESVSNVLVGLGLLVIVLAVGLLFKNQRAGFWTFIIGGVFTGFISTAYLWLSFICGAYIIFRIIKGVIGE